MMMVYLIKAYKEEQQKSFRRSVFFRNSVRIKHDGQLKQINFKCRSFSVTIKKNIYISIFIFNSTLQKSYNATAESTIG